MENQVEEVKSKVDIVSVIGERIELKKAGRNFKAPCPFHGEKTPSFMVSPELQIFKCFGCSEGGDVFTFLEKYEGMDFSEALKYLADRVGVKLKTFKGGGGEKEKLIEINSQASRFFNYVLLSHPQGAKALEYLKKERGLTLSTIKEFGIGYFPDNPMVLQKFLVEKRKFFLNDVKRASLLQFRGRIMFPLFDHRGNPIGFSGRLLPWVKVDAGKYINSPETILYHKSSVLYGLNVTRSYIKKKNVAIIVEGELDLISSYQAGIKNVVAVKGSALTLDQVKLLSRFANKFILALDADIAGDAATRRGISVATEAGVEVKIAEIEGGKDPDEVARHNLDSYKKSLIEAKNVWDFLIDSVFSRFDARSGAGKSKISREIVPILSSIEDKIVQSYYVGVVAKKLGVTPESVGEEIEKTNKNISQDSKESETINLPTKRSRRELLEERLLALIFQTDPTSAGIKEVLTVITLPLNKRIMDEYEKYTNKHKKFDLSSFSESLPKELFNGFAAMILTDAAETVDYPDQIKKELDLIKKELKILTIREKLMALEVDIKNLEELGTKDKLLTAQTKFNKLATSLSNLERESGAGVIF